MCSAMRPLLQLIKYYPILVNIYNAYIRIGYTH